MTLYRKIGGAVLALSVIAGAVPGVISSAAAIEHGKGQMLDKGPRWPHKSIHFVQLGLGLAALVATIVLVAGNNDDTPASP